ncbi:MAG: FIST C-terminal domain-containing protein [Phycisphaeraceae bacterium]|nr:FIST C-terminal domain-containing protein [Phycisphaeraceae bacterium]
MSQGVPSVYSVAGGVSDNPDAVAAVELACDKAVAALGEGGDADLVFAFASQHHAQLMGAIGDVIHRRMNPGAVLAVSGEAVIAGAQELEGKPGVSLFAARLPGASVKTFTSEDLPALTDDDDPSIGDAMAAALGVDDSLRAIVLFADPFSVPMVRLLPALSSMCTQTLGRRRAPIMGGLASAGNTPGANGLVINKRLSRTGAIGAVISGQVGVDFIVSQGCRPVGQPWLVTEAKRNIIFRLGGRKALEVIHETIEGLSTEDRQLLERGLFVGRVINEYKPRFGRGDFLIRNVVGVEQERGALAVADLVRVGQTVQFHVRDAKTASEDLQLLLSTQPLHGPALGSLLISCNGRGTRLFPTVHHDARAVSRAVLDGAGNPAPLAGFFAAGEIGPVGDQVFLHGHTATVAVFRSRPTLDIDD